MSIVFGAFNLCLTLKSGAVGVKKGLLCGLNAFFIIFAKIMTNSY